MTSQEKKRWVELICSPNETSRKLAIDLAEIIKQWKLVEKCPRSAYLFTRSGPAL